MMDRIIIGLLVFLFVLKKVDSSVLDENIKRKFIILKYKTIGILCWPIVYSLVIPKEHEDSKKMIPSFLWPYLMWGWDSYILANGLVSEKSSSQVVSVRFDPSTISSMTFALFSLLGGSSNSEYSYIFLYAVLLCIAFVFPNHNLAEGSDEDLLVESVQKTVLSWAIGMLFVGVTLQYQQQKLKTT